MSDVPESIISGAVETFNPVAESSGSIWGYVAGGVAVLVLIGFFGYKKINKPAFIINQVRKRTMKSIQEQGGENSEFVEDMDKLLDSVLDYANTNKMSGSQAVKILEPMNDSKRIKSTGDVYKSMIYIAKEVGDVNLSRELTNKSKQVKSNSALMAGLFKRAGI